MLRVLRVVSSLMRRTRNQLSYSVCMLQKTLDPHSLEGGHCRTVNWEFEDKSVVDSQHLRSGERTNRWLSDHVRTCPSCVNAFCQGSYTLSICTSGGCLSRSGDDSIECCHGESEISMQIRLHLPRAAQLRLPQTAWQGEFRLGSRLEQWRE